MTARQVLTSCADIPVGDYVSEGLSIIIPDACFPHMVIGDKAHHPWPYLRREVKHNWYCDRREPEVGFLNRDEAMLLYNLALQFRGKPALEIGSWMGWSTCHLALAGVALDVIDPVLANPEHASSTRDSLIAAEVLEHVRLYALASPDGIRELAQLTGMQWNLFFIDGNHETPAPAQDAQECLKHAAQDAMIIFHDLTAPAVEEGLHVLWRQGWHVLVYQTMQIIGVAWRGAVQPVPHKPDPSVAWSLPLHLIKYPVCGASPDEDARRLSQEIATRDQAIEHLRSALVERDRQLGSLQEELAGREAKLVCFAEQAQTQQADLERVQADMTERDRQLGSLQEELTVREAKLVCFAEQVQTQQAELARARSDMTERDRQLGSLQEELTVREAKLAELKLMHDEVQARDGEIHRLTLIVASRSQEMDRLSAEIEKLLLTLGALHNSTSWKLTRPLRGIKNGMRFLRRQARRLGSVVKQESESFSPNMPHILRIVRATGTVAPRVLRRALGSIRFFSTVWRHQRQMAALLTGSGLFDPVFYLAQNPDVRENGIHPVMHYLTRGAMEGRDPHVLFDSSFYCETNPDVAQAGVNPLVHYLLYGAQEGRDPHVLFDSSFYCETNPDVAQAGVNPLVHYLLYGAGEGRDPHALFDTSFYLEQKAHVGGLGLNPLIHFLTEGPTVDFDPFSPAPALPETNICIVTPDIVGPVKNGGIGTACYHFARVLAEAGYAVSVLFTGDVTDCQKAHWRNVYAKMRIKFMALSDTPPVTRLVYGSSWFDERSWRVFAYLRTAQFSVVHFQDWQANGFWAIRAKQVGLAFDQTTLTVMTHSCTQWINEGMKQFSASPFETAKLVWAETYCMEHCDLLLSPSRYMLQWLEANRIHTPQRTLLTPYAWADSATITPRGRAHIDSDHLIFFGRLETRKGLHIFGEAIRLLQQEGCALPRALSFLGKHASVQGQPSEAYLESLRRDLPTVDMHIINDFDYTHALDYIRQTRGLVVMPSILDNYPLTVLESIQNGLPFIAATTGGIPEMVDARVTFEPNPASLAALLKTRSTLDHRNVQHKYSSTLAAKIWCDVHTHILAAPAGSDSARTVRHTTPAPKVSVCIPFFNHQQYLETLVTAFAHQNYPAFEVILVNDGSAPEAAQEFERVARRSHDRRFRFLTTDNHGPGAARNFAAEQATGELLLFFDADNVPKGADFIGTLVRALQCSPMDCVTCPYDIVSADRIFVTERDIVATYRPIGACLVAGFFENILGDATMIIKRGTFQQLGGFSTRRAAWEDHEFLLNLCFKGFKLTTFPDAIFYYRQNPRGRNQQADNFRNYQSLFECLQEAPSEDLARIISTVSGPMLVGQPGSPTASLVAR